MAQTKIGGTKNVKIERVELTDPGYSKRRLMPEEYPFSMLEPAQKLGNGKIVGDSFFIPDSDKPQTHLARSRKQLAEKGYKFWTRKDAIEDENGKTIPGLRIWRANEEIDPDEAMRPSKAKDEQPEKTTAKKQAPRKAASTRKTSPRTKAA